MADLFRLARYAGRPLLMRSEDARAIAERVLAVDPRALERPGGPMVALRALSRRAKAAVGLRPEAMDEARDAEPDAPVTPTAYAPLWLGEPEYESDWGWTLKDGVALLSVDTALSPRGEAYCGTWYHGYDSLRCAFDEMAADARVKGIFVRWESPGGVVDDGLPELAARIREIAATKPVWAYCDVAASAAYWLASASTRMVAGNFGYVGSIGTVIVHESRAQMLEKMGVAIEAIEDPVGKTDGAWWNALSESARAALLADVQQCTRAFSAAVSAHRPALTAETLRALRGDCFLVTHEDPARSGLALGLVDAVMSERAAFAALVAEVNTGAGAAAPAPALTLAANMEEDMNRTTLAAILGDGKLSAEEKLARIAAENEAPAKTEPDEEETEDEGEDTGKGKDTDEEADDKPADAMATAQAVLDLPEAKGRERLAKKLAFEPGMTVARAKGLLAAAGKDSRLADRVSGNADIRGDGGKPDAGAALIADAKARAASFQGRRAA